MLALSGLKRPLPPPESRETVLSQMRTANGWVTLDTQEDLQICMPPKRIKLSTEGTLQSEMEPVQTMAVATEVKKNGTTTSFAPYTSDEVKPKNSEVVIKKKSLFGSIANMFGLCQTNTGEQSSQAQVVEDSKPQHIVENTQSWSFGNIDKDKTSSSSSPLPEDDQEEALRLARIANNNATYLNDQGAALSAQQSTPSNAQPDRNEIARKRLENISQERSRELREQAIARRLSMSAKTELAPKSGSDQVHSGFTNSTNSAHRGYISHQPQVTANLHDCTRRKLEIVPRSKDTSSAEIDDLFDIAAEAADDKQMFGPVNATIASKVTKPINRAHPASRAAAEQYRSQHRDSAEQSTNPLAAPNNSREFVERETRLRALTSQNFNAQETTLPTTAISASKSTKDHLPPTKVPPTIKSAPRKPLTHHSIQRLSSLLCNYDEDDSDDGGNDDRYGCSATTTKSSAQSMSLEHDRGSAKSLLSDKLAPARLSSPKAIPTINASIGVHLTSNPTEKPLPAGASPSNVVLQNSPRSTLQTPPTSQEALRPDPPRTVIAMSIERPQPQNPAINTISSRDHSSHSLLQVRAIPSMPTTRPTTAQSAVSSEISLPSTNKFKFPPLRSISMQPKPVAASSKTEPKTTAIYEEFVNYPEKPDLILPKNFESYSEEHQAVHVECALLKDRERDLEVIIPTFEQIAYLGTLDQFTDRERQEIRTVHEYVKAVIDDSLSGKRMRKRVHDVQNNMKRRVQKHATDTEPDYSTLLNTTLKLERQEHIKQLLEDTRRRLDSIKTLRDKLVAERKNKFKHRKPRSELIAKTSKHDRRTATTKQANLAPNILGNSSGPVFDNLADGAELHFSNLTSREKRRQAQYAAADRREAHLRAKLALYGPTNTEQVEPAEATSSFEDGLVEDSSDTSEEEDGADLFSGYVPIQTCKESVQPAEQALEKRCEIVNQPTESSNEPLKDNMPGESSTTTPQEQHESLVASLQQKRAQQAISTQQQAQRIDPELLNTNKNRSLATNVDGDDGQVDTELGREFDDIDESEDSSEETHTCFRYTVKAQYAGFDDFEEGEEYIHRQYLNSAAALSAVDTEIDSLRKTYLESLDPRALPKIKEEFKQEGAECSRMIELGPDAQYSCRLWIEREEYEPSREAYHNALVKQACNAKSIFTVRWERTKTPAALAIYEKIDDGEQEDASDQSQRSNSPKQDTILEINAIDSDDDDLFGSDSPSPASKRPSPAPPLSSNPPTNTPQIEIRSIAFEEQRYFTTIAQANRHAKEVFMRWYIDHLQGVKNHGYIRQADYAIEEQLASYGDFTTWERQDEFSVYVHHEDEDEDDADGTFTHNDKMRVWVVGIDVKGPAN